MKQPGLLLNKNFEQKQEYLSTGGGKFLFEYSLSGMAGYITLVLLKKNLTYA